ncbi:hypothetical protein B0A50_03513 [Salinomyces thailandicus]|uniref:BZIP domain-containing protein n=1 Tax=Salinomyces thailandicus TaxID=706561 RepID=A0A4U0U394_9PEZI|nr:hypothetical protein B0A50_03513 [Salinomyces thailandica]
MSVKVEQPADVSGKTEITSSTAPFGLQQPVALIDAHRMQVQQQLPPHQQPNQAGPTSVLEESEGGEHGNTIRFGSGQQQELPATSSNARVPLPRENSLTSAGPLPSSSGPMSSSWTPAPRPRPGRKPIPQEDAADRRRLQNRIAQRNFRDKRQQKLYETQQELEERKHEYQEHISTLQRQLEELRQEKRHSVDSLTRRLNDAEKRAQAAEKEKQQLQQMYTNRVPASYPVNAGANYNPDGLAINTTRLPTGYGGASVPTPPEDNSFGEIDFTYHFRPTNSQSQHPNALRPAISNDSASSIPMDYAHGGNGMDIEDRCGFCTDDQNCACRNEQEQLAKQRANEMAHVVAPVPGSCSACLQDPVRAQACRDLATGARFQEPSSTANGSRLYENFGERGSVSGSMGPPPRRTSCSTMVERFNESNQRTASITSLLNHGQPMQAYPSASGGYEFEEHEAAEVLSNLSRRNTIVSQPESNERNSGSSGDQSMQSA